MNSTGPTAHSHAANDRISGPTTRSERQQLMAVAWFVGLSLALAAVSFVAGVPPAMVPFILAIAPMVIALALAWSEGHGAVRRLLHGLTVRPADRRWYLVLLIPVAWSLATVAVAVALGEPTEGLFDAAFPAVLIVPLVVLIPAFTEELAWRGFALPRLMSSMSPLTASLVIAVPWTLIHVVLYLPGQWYEDLAVWPLAISIASYSVLLTWIYVGTGGSVLMTALFHAGLNGVAPLMGGIDGDASWVIRNVLAAVIALGLVALGGFRTRRTAEDPRPVATA